MRFPSTDGRVWGELDTLPGCSQVAVSHSVFVKPGHRNSGKGTVAHKERLDAASYLGYDYILCTVDSNNAAQIKILEANNWHKLDGFYSSKTGHNVLIYGRITPTNNS